MNNERAVLPGARLSQALLLLFLAASLPGRAAWAWGPLAHQAVTSRAIGTLPKGLEPFYKAHRLELPTLSPEGKKFEEGPERRFAVDTFLAFPFTDLPHTEGALKDQYGEAAGKAGRLPWLVLESYDRLVEAFKAKDREKIVAESDTLAALVADLHNPLALTKNHDGQTTGQHGLWIRFSVKFPEVMEKHLGLNPDAARFLDDPRGFVFEMVNANYVWLDNLLYSEELARRGKSGYGEIYFESLTLRAGDILKARLSKAAEDAGSYWYTAWTAAGRPEVK